MVQALRPMMWIDKIADILWPAIKPFSDDVIFVFEKVFNLILLLILHTAIKTVNIHVFVIVVFLIAVCKTIMIKILEHRANYPIQSPDSENLRANILVPTKILSKTCRKDSFSLINQLIKKLWFTHRRYMKLVLMEKVWPLLREKFSSFKELQLIDFNLGDTPLRVNLIECLVYSKKKMVIDIEMEYDGGSDFILSHGDKETSIPLSFTINNMKLRCVLNDMVGEIPFIGGVQLFFLEEPEILWETPDFIVDKLVADLIQHRFMTRWVLPNRFASPTAIPKWLSDQLEQIGINVHEEDDYVAAMPAPLGVLQVRVVNAIGLREVDVSLGHYLESRKLDICMPDKCLDLLPERYSCNPYVEVSVGRETYQSSVCTNTSDPDWNFSCEFVIEHFHKADIKVSIREYETQLLLGRISEKVKNVRDRKTFDNWYNSQIFQGSAFLKFKWIPVSRSKELELSTDEKQKGVLSLLMGKFYSSIRIRPLVILKFYQGGTKIGESKSRDSYASHITWRLYEGKMFRLNQICHPELKLEMEVFDHISDRFVGSRTFSIARLREIPLYGSYKLKTDSKNHDLIISLYSEILFDNDAT